MNKWIIILLFCIFNLFFGMIPEIKQVSAFSIIACALFYASRISGSIYNRMMLLFGLGVIGAIVSCKAFRGQSYMETFKAMQFYYGILFYYVLKASKTSQRVAENALLTLVYILDVLYILQYFLLPYGYNFLGIDEWMISEDKESGGTRLRVVSSGLYLVGLMYGLSKWYVYRKFRYLPIFLLGVFIMLLSGYRQFVASLFVTIIFMFYVIDGKIRAKQVKYIILFGVISIILFTIPSVQEKLMGMVARNESGQNLTDSDYIRVVQFEFFTQQYFTNGIEYFLGSGIPYGTSAFGKWFESYREMGIQYVDWGIIGFSWMMGIPTAIAIIWLFVKGIKVQVSVEHKYLGLYLFFLLTTSITNWELFRQGNFLVHAMVLYIIEQAHAEYIQSGNTLTKKI